MYLLYVIMFYNLCFRFCIHANIFNIVSMLIFNSFKLVFIKYNWVFFCFLVHVDYFYFENGFKKIYSNGENYSHKRTTEISGGKKIKIRLDLRTSNILGFSIQGVNYCVTMCLHLLVLNKSSYKAIQSSSDLWALMTNSELPSIITSLCSPILMQNLLLSTLQGPPLLLPVKPFSVKNGPIKVDFNELLFWRGPFCAAHCWNLGERGGDEGATIPSRAWLSKSWSESWF